MMLKTRMDCNRFARQLFGMYSFSYACEEERRRKKMNKIEIFTFVFSNLSKVSETFGLDIILEY